ncbi:glycosyltransferase family 4 protein [Methylomarinum vadi]|uniref:glycosyltransferase family 4 protein n=1 Tax=Methylomarinum vadi TaxID=438855 RepID=UPI0004DFCC67|nr:glycosyltransferase family 1 protein [Methylomarinum vadi]
MKIVIVTDAWEPQVNGVINTLKHTAKVIESKGHEVRFITPQFFKTVPTPTYPEIRLSLFPFRKLEKMIDEIRPQVVHIATEGPLGLAARRYCKKYKLRFTTAYHTQFPEYIRLRAPVPLSVSYAFMRWFHGGAVYTLVTTESMHEHLSGWGLKNLKVWTRGVDTDLFCQGDKKFLNTERPVFMYIGRVAVEKNIQSFLELDLPGSKYVVGDGPQLQELKEKFPEVTFTGYVDNHLLSQHLAAADVFVFPSKTDTFGLVLLEANASGLPIAAYPVPGPKDVVIQGINGHLSEDLREACMQALQLSPDNCRKIAEQYSWERVGEQLLSYLQVNDVQDGLYKPSQKSAG